jgi:DNA polymerase V
MIELKIAEPSRHLVVRTDAGHSGTETLSRKAIMSYSHQDFSTAFDQAVILGKIPLEMEDAPSVTIPLFLERISAGFPSPADDYIEAELDLNRLLIKNQAATFLVRVGGDSMINAGIHDKDIMVVDKSEEAIHGKIVVAVVDGEFTVKRLYMKNGKCMLVPENPRFKSIMIGPEQELNVWGVVVGVVRKM